MLRWKVGAAAALAAVLSLSACADSSSDGNSTGGSGTLTLGAIATPTSMAAASSRWANWAPFYQAVYDPLIRSNADGTLAPWLATKWSYNPDNTILTMTLRDDVTFTDGTKFTADVAAQNLIRFRDGDSQDASQLASIKDVKATDATTLVITLRTPDPALLNYLGKNDGMMESPKAFKAADVKTNPIGSGPYILDTSATVTGSKYVYKKNPDYWAKDVQHYSKLVINYYADATAALNAIKGGQANAVKLVTNDNNAQVKSAGWSVNQNQLDYWGLLLLDRSGKMNPAIGKLKVRQAINYAFDRAALLKTIGSGEGTVTEQIFPQRSPAYDASLDSTYNYAPAKAKQLLAEAGYPNGFALNMPSTTLLGSATYDLVKQQLADIGIKVTYTDAGNNYIDDLLGAKYAAAVMALQEDPNDWQLAQFSLTPTATWNPFRYQDKTADGYFHTMQFGSESERAQAAKDLNKYLVDQAWFAPWYRSNGSFASDAGTSVTMSQTNAYPMLYDLKPKD